MAPLCEDYTSLMTYCAVFGFTIGAYVGLTSVILVDLLGLEKLTNAFGLLLLFQGIASFIGAPIGGKLLLDLYRCDHELICLSLSLSLSGFMYDKTGTYTPAFLMAGLMIAFSGLVMFAIPPLQRYQARKTAQKGATEQLALS